MSNERLEITLDLANDKVQFKGVSKRNPNYPVTFDYLPPLGDGEGLTGLEAFLLSFAGCSSTSIVALLRKMRKQVTSFRMEASGTRREQNPTCFEKIFINFAVESPDVQEEDIMKALKMSEDSICPVWAMIRGNVEVVAEYTIVRK